MIEVRRMSLGSREAIAEYVKFNSDLLVPNLD
jgi:hypothetical protein